MYSFLHNLLSDKKGGEIFALFSAWHFLYIFLTALAIVVLLAVFKNKTNESQKRLQKVLINICFALYMADFFLMPLAYGEIDIEKLPFHACTAMCVMCFLSYRIPFIEKYKTSFVMLGFISNLVYLIYPAGVMWHAVHPLSYRAVQTLIFHSVMTVYGFVTLAFERQRISFKTAYRELYVLLGMTVWAIIGNYAYNGTSEGYSHFFNWFFVVRDPFYALPEAISPFIMPFLNIFLFFCAQMLLHLVIWVSKRGKKVCLEENDQ